VVLAYGGEQAMPLTGTVTVESILSSLVKLDVVDSDKSRYITESARRTACSVCVTPYIVGLLLCAVGVVWCVSASEGTLSLSVSPANHFSFLHHTETSHVSICYISMLQIFHAFQAPLQVQQLYTAVLNLLFCCN